LPTEYPKDITDIGIYQMMGWKDPRMQYDFRAAYSVLYTLVYFFLL